MALIPEIRGRNQDRYRAKKSRYESDASHKHLCDFFGFDAHHTSAQAKLLAVPQAALAYTSAKDSREQRMNKTSVRE